MRRLIIPEHTDVSIGSVDGVSEPEARALAAIDDRRKGARLRPVFEWKRHSLRTQGIVGVIQVPGLCVELVPKVERYTPTGRAQANLMYMLLEGGQLPFRSAGAAGLVAQNLPLLDAFALLFSRDLLFELRKGVDRSYRTYEENLQLLRGRLLVHQHVRKNSFQRERLFCRFDDFTADTDLNRTLKAAADLLLRRCSSTSARRNLGEVLHRFDSVEPLPRGEVPDVRLSRMNRRFQGLLDFARLVLEQRTPTLLSGAKESYSLLFEMHRVFEAFVANVLRRNIEEIAEPGTTASAQVGGLWLVRDSKSRGRVALRPDIVVRPPDGPPVVIDTKWKNNVEADPISGVTPSDAHQMFAYGQLFEAAAVVLLYPSTEPRDPTSYVFDADGRRLRVAFVNVGRDLALERPALLAELVQACAPSSRNSETSSARS